MVTYKFTVEVMCEQDIIRLQISVCDSLFVHEFQRGHNFSSVKPGQVSGQYFALLEQLLETALLNVLK